MLNHKTEPMDMQGTSFSDKQLNKLFPFYLKINRALEITALGTSLERLCQAYAGEPASHHFKLVADGATNWDAAYGYTNKPVALVCLWNSAIELTGELELLEGAGELIFIGSPSIKAVQHAKTNSGTADSFGPIQGGTLMGSPTNGYIKPHSRPAAPNVAEQNINSIVISDKSGNIEWVSSAFEAKTGYTLSEIKGKRPQHFLYGEESIFVPLDYVDSKTIERKPFSFQNIAYTKDGATFWFRATVHPIVDRQNEITG